MQDYHDNAHASGDTISFDGTLSMSATVQSKSGQMIDIGYSVDIKASAEIGWENDEYASGWNYSTDEPTFTSSSSPVYGNITISSVTFTPNGEFILNNEETSLAEIQQHVDVAVLKQLLNPLLYTKELDKLFVKSLENFEPPRNDYNGPDDE